jgi:hypothetical protein
MFGSKSPKLAGVHALLGNYVNWGFNIIKNFPVSCQPDLLCLVKWYQTANSWSGVFLMICMNP